MKESERHGILRISNEADRQAIAALLFKNEYSVQLIRRKDGRKNEYWVKYDLPESIDEVIK